MVHLASDSEQRGVVVDVIPGKPEYRYIVFIDGEKRQFYASQLSVEKTDDQRKYLSLTHFHAHLSARQIRHPSSSTLYSLNAARVDFVPYQFRPVLKFIQSDRPRLLIADGVGVGKTIEAGLVLRELESRREVRSVLIICPKALVTDRKWQLEMKRFDERFTQLDGPTLRYCMTEADLDGVWPQEHSNTIVPYSLFDESLLVGGNPTRNRKNFPGLEDLSPPPRFDLVIVDEAHHIRNTETYSHKVVRFFCDNAEAVLFLTATPVQLGDRDLFVLLNVLRPDLIVDEESFHYMAQPNKYVNRAIEAARAAGPKWQKKAGDALVSAGNTEWGQTMLSRSPSYREVREQLGTQRLGPAERVQTIKKLEDLHTFSNLINRTRRRDIGEFTTRKPQTVRVELTEKQKALHDRLLAVQARILGRLHADINVKFLMTTIRRQAASCLFGLAPLLEDILNRRMSELVEQESTEAYDGLPELSTVDRIKADIEEVLKDAEGLQGPDRKLEALRGIVTDKQAMANNRTMLFSTFRHTLSYLFRHLENDGYRVGLMHGGTPDDERVRIRDRFRLPRNHEDALDIVLFSEVACEGLDFEFCDCLVNYDLPWNPMRIEQRIGRIDRHGQKSETVAIYNMITPDTVDAEIYDRCLSRIGVFERALGGNEEILGQITHEIRDIAEDLDLNREERNARLQQLADNEIREIQEQERLEKRQKDLFGIRLPNELLQEQIENASSYWLSPDGIENLVTQYLAEVSGSDTEHLLGGEPLKTLRVPQGIRERLLSDFRKIDCRPSEMARQWERFLRGNTPHLPVTFDAACARDNREAAFVMSLHPLALQAAAGADARKKLYTAFEVADTSLSEGDYPFAIYEWRYRGVREELALKPVCDNIQLTDKFLSLLQKGRPLERESDRMPGESAFLKLDKEHYRIWNKAREEHRKHTVEMVAYKRESLRRSHDARIGLLKDQLSEATEDNIRRMRQSQIENAERDYVRRMKELTDAEERADIMAQPVAFGTIRIKREHADAN
jgi:SNF2 family DNA or RNA helicase